MTQDDSLWASVQATHRSLEERLGEALAPHRDRQRPRDGYAATDSFLAATSRHVAAAEAVLVPHLRREVPDGEALARDYLAAARRLELTLSLLKARLYGEAHAVHLEWPDLWESVRVRLSDHNRLEDRLVEEVRRHSELPVLEPLAGRLHSAETRAPSRPHPRLPHSGPLSLVARRVWAVADRFWDTAEGRVVPAPVAPRPRRHESLLAQYLLADPMFEAQAQLVGHRGGHHAGRPGALASGTIARPVGQ